MSSSGDRPVIGITANNGTREGREIYFAGTGYARAVTAAGGVPVILTQEPDAIEAYLATCDGFVLTGGYDPDVRAFGDVLHPQARLIEPQRQKFETALLAALGEDRPVLGICLGMQMMGLAAGATLTQYLPDVLANPEVHKDGEHRIESLWDNAAWEGDTAGQTVVSSHQQALANGGRMRVIARARDGVVEAIDAPSRRFFVGVQWHPERGDGGPLNQGLFARLVAAARRAT